MAIRFGNDQEMSILLRVKDDGTAVVERFADHSKDKLNKSSKDVADTAERETKRAGTAWDGLGRKIGIAAAAGVAALAAMVKSQINAADEVGKLSERTGIAVETLSEWRHIAQQSGATIESITPGLRTLARNMQDAANGTGEALKSLKDLDIEVTNAEGGLRSMDDVMLDVADRFSGMTDGAAKAAFAQRLFGESGTALIPALNRGRDGIRELTTEAQQLGKVFTAEAAKAAADFNDAIATLRDSVTQMAREFVIDHAPAIKRIATEMANAAREGGALKGIVEGLRQAFSEMLPGGGDAVEQERRRLNMLTIELVDLEAQLQKVQGLSGFTRGLLGLPSEEALRQRIENIKAERQRLTQWLAAEDAKLEQGSVPEQKLNPTVHPSEADEKAREEARKKRLKELEAEEQARVQREADLHQRLKDIADKREMEAAQRQAEALARHRAQAEFERKTLEEEQRLRDEKKAEEEAEAEARRQRVISVMDSLRSERAIIEQDFAEKSQILQAWYREQDEMLRTMHENEQLGTAETNEQLVAMKVQHMALMRELTEDYETAITAIEDREIKRRFGIAQVYRKLDFASAQAWLASMAVLMQSSSKTMFEIGKAFAIADTIMQTYRAAQGAYAAMASIHIIGPALGGAAAAAAIVAGIARVQAIKATTVGSQAAAPVFQANPSTGLPTSPVAANDPQIDQPAQATPRLSRREDVTLVGDFFSQEWMREKMIPLINKAQKDGVYIDFHFAAA